MTAFKAGDRVTYPLYRRLGSMSDEVIHGVVVRVDDDPDYPVVVDFVGVPMRYRAEELTKIEEEEE